MYVKYQGTLEDGSKDVAVVTKILEDMKQQNRQSAAAAIFFTESEGSQNSEKAPQEQELQEAKA